jgi:NADH-quinone oxidoreductase subunit C
MKTAEAVHYLKGQLNNVIVSETNFHDEVTLQLNKENLKAVLKLLKTFPEPGFETLMDMTGVDYLQPVIQTKVVYLLHNPVSYARLRITLFVAREENIPSIVDLWEGADWYERELYDLFGIKFEGRSDLQRILMPDDWKGHPLRKDYALIEESVEFKHGVKPKVPSEIIPYVKSK